MAAPYLKITKPEAGGKYGLVSFIPNVKANRAFYDNQNRLLKENEKWLIVEATEEDKKAHEANPGHWKDEKFVSGKGAELLAASEAKVKESEQKLAELQAELENKQQALNESLKQLEESKKKQAEADDTLKNKQQALNESGAVSAQDAVAKIQTLATAKDVEDYTKDDSRVTVQKAAQAKIDALSGK